ncbi:MAG: hypothetical protein AAB672_02180 [Patescibacteria group bacterium]
MLPEFLKSNFWFVKFDKLDRERDKDFIVFQILNHGGFEDWKWVFLNYSKDEIQQIVKKSVATAWFRQSLGLWQNVLDITARPTRFPDLPVQLSWPH